jgi:hypothetical protein
MINNIFWCVALALVCPAIALAQNNPAPAPTQAVPATPAPEPTLPPNFHRDKPAYIVIKTDDLIHTANGDLPPNWEAYAAEIKKRNIKTSMGIICNSLEGDNPKFTQWIKDLQATGLVEFWFHGYDHKPHIENGMIYGELDGRSYDDIKQRFTKSQQLAQDKLGFPLRSYGQPGASPMPGAEVDRKTNYKSLELLRALREDPNITTWMTASTPDDIDKEIESEGRITVLDRIYQVNIEQPIFKPNIAAFIKGYAQFPNREYFVIQGHPGFWSPDGYAQFLKILDFLQQQNAVFVTPTEMADILKKEGKGASATPSGNATSATTSPPPAAQ